MASLRKPELKESPPPTQTARLQRLKNLVCSGAWSGEDEIVLIYWKPDESRWVAWVDAPAPSVDPLPEAEVDITP